MYIFQFHSETNVRKTFVSFQVYGELLKNSFCFRKYCQPCKLPVKFLWHTLSIQTDFQIRCFFTDVHNSTILKLFPNIKPCNAVFSKTTKTRSSSEAVQATFTEQRWKLYTSFSLRYIGSDIAKNLFTSHIKVHVCKILATGRITSNKQGTILLS